MSLTKIRQIDPVTVTVGILLISADAATVTGLALALIRVDSAPSY